MSDESKLAELSRDLGAIDVDAASANRIAHRARADLGRGPSRLRFGEPVLVAIFTLSLLAWALIKVLEVLG
jgi:hypothetical protein